MRPFLAAIALLMGILWVGGDAVAAADVTLRTNVRYGKGKVQRLDLYRSDKTPARSAPVLLWIHGGGFTQGRRQDMDNYSRAFAERGYVTATMSYRLTGRPEDATADARTAVRWLRREASRLRIDPRRIVVGGYSAGAYTALAVGFGDGVDVAGSISIAGGVWEGWIDRGDPAALVIHGTRDDTVPYERGRRVCVVAKQRGVPCKLVPFRGVGHEVAYARFDGVVAAIDRWKPSRLRSR
jgi:acetyl esterase/lipase